MLENILLTRYSNKLYTDYTISIDPLVVNELYNFLIQEKQKEFKMSGFDTGRIPISYIKNHFKKSIESCITEIFYSLYVNQEIIKVIRGMGSIVLSNLIPRITFDLNDNILNYTFDIPNSYCVRENEISIKKIKYPLRKKYKDLDKQAELIYTTELKNLENASQFIEAGDWVKLELKLLGDNFSKKLESMLTCYVWLKISKEQIDLDIYKLFSNKKLGDVFISNNQLFYDFICSHHFINFKIQITIVQHVQNLFFSFDKFKKYFGIKNILELYNRIIDVLSFRNDICLRREICQLVFKHLFDYYKIHLRDDIIKIFEEDIHRNIIYNPDYLIYHSSRYFHNQIRKLACKQSQEISFIDFISQNDKITVSDDDMYLYLNIMQRNRFKNFLYFDYSLLQIKKKEVPISHEIIYQMVLREKTLQYYIKMLQR